MDPEELAKYIEAWYDLDYAEKVTNHYSEGPYKKAWAQAVEIAKNRKKAREVKAPKMVQSTLF